MLDNSIILKLESLCARSEEIKVDLSAEGATDNMAKFTQLNKEFSEITPVVNLFKSLKDFEEELSGAKELLDSGDAELIELAKSDISISEGKIAQLEKDLKFMLLPKDDADDGSAYLEIRAGAGGDEAASHSRTSSLAGGAPGDPHLTMAASHICHYISIYDSIRNLGLAVY